VEKALSKKDIEPFYVSELCNIILKQIEDGKYFDCAFKILKKHLLNPGSLTDKDKETIEQMSQFLLEEIAVVGYTLNNDLATLPLRLMDTNVWEYEGFPRTFFPYDTESTQFQLSENEGDLSAFVQAVKDEVGNLSLEQRIDKFALLLSKPAEQYFLTVRVQGLKPEKGSEDIIEVGWVTFYAPDKHRFLPDSSVEKTFKNIELFGQTEGNCYLNARVSVPFRGRDGFSNADSAKEDGIRQIYQALSTFALYRNLNTIDILPKVDSLQYLMTNQQNNKMTFRYNFGKVNDWEEAINWNKAHTLGNNSSKDQQHMNTYINNPQNEIEKIIADSLFWYRKGIASSSYSETILNCWIAIANILGFTNTTERLSTSQNTQSNEFESALRFIPAFMVGDYGIDNAKMLIARLNTDIFSIPIEVHKLIRSKTTIQGVIECLPQVSVLLSGMEYEVLRGKVDECQRFFQDNQYASKQLQQYKLEIEHDVRMCYRFRNQITHNARVHNPLFAFYSRKIANITQTLLQHIVSLYRRNKNHKIENILNVMMIRMETKFALLDATNDNMIAIHDKISSIK
jgi:hypothetical protein